MTLVNDTDANRENIDEYMKELEHLSDQQLVLLSTLGEVCNQTKQFCRSTNCPHMFLSFNDSPLKATTCREAPVVTIQVNTMIRSRLIFESNDINFLFIDSRISDL